MTQKFIIVASARTGSTAISEGLRTHPLISCIYEPWHPGGFDFIRGQTNAITLRNHESIIRHVWEIPKEPIRGCKHIISHEVRKIDNCQGFFENVVNRYPEIRCIILFRKDIISQAISYLVACKYGQWYSFHDKTNNLKVEINPQLIINQIIFFIKSNEIINKVINNPSLHVLILYYEDFCNNITKALYKCQDFIGVPKEQIQKLASPLRPQNMVNSWKEIVINYDEIISNIAQNQNIRSFLKNHCENPKGNILSVS